jgi:hypothetical protein
MWRIIMGSGSDVWICWHFFTTTINHDCLRLAPFLAGLRVSYLPRDWLVSDLRIGHFFSFRCPLVNTPQLIAELLNCLLNSLTNESLEFTNEVSFVTTGGPNSRHHTEQFAFWSVSVVAETSEPLPSKWTPASVAITALRRCLPSHCLANGHIRHNNNNSSNKYSVPRHFSEDPIHLESPTQTGNAPIELDPEALQAVWHPLTPFLVLRSFKRHPRVECFALFPIRVTCS